MYRDAFFHIQGKDQRKLQHTHLTFQRPGCYLNFGARFTENVLLGQKKIK